MNINLFLPKYRKEEIFEHLSECFEKGWTGLGFKTIEIENKWKEYTDLPNAHFLNSNTSGLHLAIKILKDANKWKDGDEIITTPFTFVSTNHVILYENLRPVFADIDEYLCLDPLSVEKKITRKTRAVMFIGIGGNIGKLQDIVKICKENNLHLILDAAHMAGTKIFENKWQHVGKEADVSVFSFQSVKNLPTADAGMICFKNDDYDKLARKLSWLGIDKDTYQRTHDKGSYKWEYDVIDTGFKYHGNSVMASFALVGLKYLDEDNKYRNDLSNLYTQLLKNIEEVKIIQTAPFCKSSHHLYQIIVDNRNEMMEYLNASGIYPGVHYTDNTKYPMYNYAYGSCPVSKSVSEKVISLPLHLGLEEKDIIYIIDKIKEFLKLWK
jgi:dTDP-4-amino-4,6-dideoxygalactose transaminase